MSTLIDNVNRIYTDKEAIKQAIIAKGVAIPDGTSLDEYASLIAKINTGVDTSDATATSSDMASGKTAYVGGKKITGSVPVITSGSTLSSVLVNSDLAVSATTHATDSYNKGSIITKIPTTKSSRIIKPGGGLEVSNKQVAEAIGLTADKIVSGNTILGVTGTGGRVVYKTGKVSSLGGTMTTTQTFKEGTAVRWGTGNNSTVISIPIPELKGGLFKKGLVTLYCNEAPGFRISRGYNSGTTTAAYWYIYYQEMVFGSANSNSSYSDSINHDMRTTRSSYPYNEYCWYVRQRNSGIIEIYRDCYKDPSASGNPDNSINDTLCVYDNPLNFYVNILLCDI